MNRETKRYLKLKLSRSEYRTVLELEGIVRRTGPGALEELQLTPWLTNKLRGDGIPDIPALEMRTPRSLTRIDGVGWANVARVQDALEEMGKKLAD